MSKIYRPPPQMAGLWDDFENAWGNTVDFFWGPGSYQNARTTEQQDADARAQQITGDPTMTADRFHQEALQGTWDETGGWLINQAGDIVDAAGGFIASTAKYTFNSVLLYGTLGVLAYYLLTRKGKRA